MITDLNNYLMAAAPYEKRGQIIYVARTLESVIGENIYIAIDEVIQSEDALDYNVAVDSIQEALLASLETAYAKFGIFFDEDLIDKRHLFQLSNTLETLCQLELNEERDYLISLIEAAEDPIGALVDVLDVVSPGSVETLEEVVSRVSPDLLIALKTALRDNNVETSFESFESDEIHAAYVKRCQEFKARYGRPALVGELLAHGAKLRYDPMITLSLISNELDTEHAESAVKELYALAVYSSCPTLELVPTTKRLIDAVCPDPAHVLTLNEALHKLLGGNA